MPGGTDGGADTTAAAAAGLKTACPKVHVRSCHNSLDRSRSDQIRSVLENADAVLLLLRETRGGCGMTILALALCGAGGRRTERRRRGCAARPPPPACRCVQLSPNREFRAKQTVEASRVLILAPWRRGSAQPCSWIDGPSIQLLAASQFWRGQAGWSPPADQPPWTKSFKTPDQIIRNAGREVRGQTRHRHLGRRVAGGVMPCKALVQQICRGRALPLAAHKRGLSTDCVRSRAGGVAAPWMQCRT